MSLKNILLLLIFSLLAIYLAFLNPHKVEVYLTQSYSLHMPMVLLLLGFILIGVLVTVFLNWSLQLRSSLGRMKASLRRRRNEKRDRQCQKNFEKGESAFAGGNLGRARAVFERILEEYPRHAGALDYMGQIVVLEGNPDRAVELFLKASQASPGTLKVLYGLASAYADAGKPDKEVEVLERILRAEPNAVRALSRIRDAYSQKKDWKNACAIQKRLLPLIQDKEEKQKEQERFAQLIYCHGMNYWERGSVDSAISEFKKALRIDPKCLPAHITLGDAYLKSGNKKAALKTWQSGFGITHSPLCLLRIQKFHQDSGDLTDAVKIYQKAIGSTENSEKDVLVLLLGALYLDRSDADEAIRMLENALPEKSVPHWLLLANAYRLKHDTGQMEKASESAYRRMRESIIEFTCGACKKSFGEWQGFCPECRSWNSLVPGIQPTVH